MFFEIILSRKGDGYRVRTSCMSNIPNIKNLRPEATSQYSYEDAIQKLVPKIETALLRTTKKLGGLFKDKSGRLMFSIENISQDKTSLTSNNSISFITSIVTEALKNIMINNNSLESLSTIVENNISSSVSIENNETKKLQDVIIEWQQELHRRTKKDYEDQEYFSPTTLESYSRNLRAYVFPYLDKHPEFDYINVFNETNVDEIFYNIKCEDTKRVLLISLKLIFEFAKGKSYISLNPLTNKKLKATKKTKKKKDFENDYKKIPIYDEVSMKRTGWKKGDGPLKTPESYRHIALDLLIQPLLVEHKKNQKEEFRKTTKKWSENEYVFLNSDRTPFTPDILSKNFNKFIRRNNLPHIVLHGLRHSFATHCRNLGMKADILALLMGHTEYETTQKYYIHISSKQKKDELKKVQHKDIQNYLGEQNKELIHLQNNITQCYKKDLSHYTNDESLITTINEHGKIIA